MKKFHIPLSPLVKGLRRHYQEVKNSFELSDLFNLQPTSNGLVPYEPVDEAINYENLVQAGLIEDFPFPQLFIGKKHVILAGSKKVYLVNREDFNQPLIELVTYDADNPDDEVEIQEGDPWQFVDMQDTWILSNGSCLVFYPGKDTMIGSSFKVYVKRDFHVGAITYWRGRIVMGGFDPQNFWSDEWKSSWQKWSKEVVDTGLSLTDADGIFMPMQRNFIWWSQVDAGDFLFLFFPNLMKSGYLNTTYDEDRPILFDLMSRNDWGFMTLAVGGEVIRLLPLGDFLIAYTRGGVVALFNVIDPEPHLGQKVIHKIGVMQHAVAGGNNSHVFIDQGGNLVRIDSDGKVKTEGYREFFIDQREQQMIGLWSSDPKDLLEIGTFYFCNESLTFVYNGELTKTGQVLRSVHYWNGQTIGITDNYLYKEDPAYLEMEVFDFGVSGFKQIESIQVDYAEDELRDEKPRMKASVAYRYKMSSPFVWSESRNVNHQGYCYLPITSIQFKLKVEIEDYGKIKRIWGITPTVKFVDRRFAKSVSIGQIAASASK